MTDEANPLGATNLLDIANNLSNTMPEPEQPTGELPETTETTPETPEGEPKAESRRVTAKLGDREIEFDLITEDADPNEFKSGLMMEADYRKKTAELAENRRSIDGRLTELGEALDNAKLLLEMDLDSFEQNSQELRDEDPAEYVRQLDALTERSKKYQASKEKLDAELAEKSNQNRVRQQQLLNDAIPAWLDESVKESDIKLMTKTLSDAGYSDEDMAAIDDYKTFVLARKAALYDQVMSQNLTAKKDTTPPKSMKPGAKGAEAPEQLTDARKRLKETGNVHDLAAVLAGR